MLTRPSPPSDSYFDDPGVPVQNLYALPAHWEALDHGDFLDERRPLMAPIIRRGPPCWRKSKLVASSCVACGPRTLGSVGLARAFS